TTVRPESCAHRPAAHWPGCWVSACPVAAAAEASSGWTASAPLFGLASRLQALSLPALSDAPAFAHFAPALLVPARPLPVPVLPVKYLSLSFLPTPGKSVLLA